MNNSRSSRAFTGCVAGVFFGFYSFFFSGWLILAIRYYAANIPLSSFIHDSLVINSISYMIIGFVVGLIIGAVSSPNSSLERILKRVGILIWLFTVLTSYYYFGKYLRFMSDGLMAITFLATFMSLLLIKPAVRIFISRSTGNQ